MTDTSTPPPGDPEHPHLRALASEAVQDLPEVPHAAPRQSASALAFGEERPSIVQAMGGTMGIIESGVPSVAFIAAVTAGASTKLSAVIAVAVAILFAVVRVARRETVQFAITGIFGVVISALVAGATGKAKAFYLPGFLINIGYGLVALISVILRRPFVGYIADSLQPAPEGATPWREDPEKMRVYNRASLLWVAIFFGRLVIEVPFYLTNHLVALGTVKIVLSYPLFGIGVWLTWVMLRAAGLAGQQGAGDEGAG
ncbi:MAG: DUF3159 domain-containing protein, partial [Patulibacter sp.]|nr:DUF3159 domain-containing protein [Patulibacter sp.]